MRPRPCSPARTTRSEASCARRAGWTDFLERYAVIVMSDHGQTPVTEVTRLAERFRHEAETLVTASNRAAYVYRLGAERPAGADARRAARR